MAFNPLKFVALPEAEKPREQQVAEAAYFRALKRGFIAGHDAEDWKAAEKEVDEANALRSAPRDAGVRSRPQFYGPKFD